MDFEILSMSANPPFLPSEMISAEMTGKLVNIEYVTLTLYSVDKISVSPFFTRARRHKPILPSPFDWLYALSSLFALRLSASILRVKSAVYLSFSIAFSVLEVDTAELRLVSVS